MKKKFQKIMIGALGALCVSCMAFSVNAITTASADGETAPTDFRMVGASIRLDSPTGIRFETNIADADKVEGATYGTIITRATLLGATELTKAACDEAKMAYVDIPTVNWMANPTLSTEETPYSGYYGTLVGGANDDYEDFEEKYYTEIFVARGYVTYANGATYYTSNTLERTIAGVAYSYENDDNYDGHTTSAAIVEKATKATLTYDDDSDKIETKTMPIGAILNATQLPEEPTKEGYTFEGWFYEDDTQAFIDNEHILKADTTVTAKWQTTESSITLDGSAITLLNTEKGTYVKQQNGNYLYTKTGHMSNGTRKELEISESKFDGLMANGNYIVVKMKSNSIGYVLHGANSNWTYDCYDINFGALNRPVADTWIYSVWEIGSNSEAISGLGNTIGDGNSGSASTPATWEIASVTVCSSAKFAEMKAAGEALATATKIERDGSAITLYNAETGTYVKQESGNYLYTKSAHMTSAFYGEARYQYQELGIDTSEFGTLYAKDNYVIITMVSSGKGYVYFGNNPTVIYPTYLDENFEDKLTDKRPNAGVVINVIYKIGSNSNYLGDTFGNGDSSGTWEIMKVTVCTEAEYQAMLPSAPSEE